MKNYWIYFIQSGHGPVKIGLSRDPKWRMKTLQIGNPEKLELVAAMPGSMRDERDLHKRFEASHIRSLALVRVISTPVAMRKCHALC